ncbi:hypothetical protein EDD16DRAFT_1657557 [Pisolithus croceorrhizus]|nr:hypothetical protein EDD16DRAFT_1657557 [Pisolithus croceorrhizus]
MAKEPQSRDLRECIKLIKEMTTIIDPADDYLTITAAEEQMKVNYAKAKRENDEAYSNLKALSRVLEAARKSSARPWTPTRISLAKALPSKEAELAALKEGARALEESDPAQIHQHKIDGTTIRLQIFRGMGFDIVLDSGWHRGITERAVWQVQNLVMFTHSLRHGNLLLRDVWRNPPLQELSCYQAVNIFLPRLALVDCDGSFSRYTCCVLGWVEWVQCTL